LVAQLDALRRAVWDRRIRNLAEADAAADDEPASLCLDRSREGEGTAQEHQSQQQSPLSHVILLWSEFEHIAKSVRFLILGFPPLRRHECQREDAFDRVPI